MRSKAKRKAAKPPSRVFKGKLARLGLEAERVIDHRQPGRRQCR